MTTTTAPTTSRQLTRSTLVTGPVWLVGGCAALVAAAATEGYALAVRALGVPLAAGNIGAATAEPIAAGGFAMGTFICTFWGTLLAIALARWAVRPARTFLRVAITLTALSLLAPAAATATTSTKIILALAHLLAAAIVIPTLTRRLTRTDTR